MDNQTRPKEDRYNWPPLRLQFEQGQNAFNMRKQWTKTTPNGETVIVTANPFPPDTMKHKEWQRGYDTAYHEQLSNIGRFPR